MWSALDRADIGNAQQRPGLGHDQAAATESSRIHIGIARGKAHLSVQTLASFKHTEPDSETKKA